MGRHDQSDAFRRRPGLPGARVSYQANQLKHSTGTAPPIQCILSAPVSTEGRQRTGLRGFRGESDGRFTNTEQFGFLNCTFPPVFLHIIIHIHPSCHSIFESVSWFFEDLRADSFYRSEFSTFFCAGANLMAEHCPVRVQNL